MSLFPIDRVGPTSLRASKKRGVHLAIVVENKDGDGNPGYQVRVKYPWMSEEEKTYWARVAVPMGGKDRGTYFLPEIDDQLLVVFEHGDINRPIVIGSLWSKKQEPVEVNESGKNNTKLIKSRSGHRIIFDDTKGAERVVIVDKTMKNKIILDSANKLVAIHAAGDIEIKASNDVIMSAKSLKFGSSGAVSTTGQKVLVHSAATIGVKGSGMKLDGASVTVNQGGGNAASVSGAGSGYLGGAGGEDPREQIAENARGGTSAAGTGGRDTGRRDLVDAGIVAGAAGSAILSASGGGTGGTGASGGTVAGAGANVGGNPGAASAGGNVTGTGTPVSSGGAMAGAGANVGGNPSAASAGGNVTGTGTPVSSGGAMAGAGANVGGNPSAASAGSNVTGTGTPVGSGGQTPRAGSSVGGANIGGNPSAASAGGNVTGAGTPVGVGGPSGSSVGGANVSGTTSASSAGGNLTGTGTPVVSGSSVDGANVGGDVNAAGARAGAAGSSAPVASGATGAGASSNVNRASNSVTSDVNVNVNLDASAASDAQRVADPSRVESGMRQEIGADGQAVLRGEAGEPRMTGGVRDADVVGRADGELDVAAHGAEYEQRAVARRAAVTSGYRDPEAEAKGSYGAELRAHDEASASVREGQGTVREAQGIAADPSGSAKSAGRNAATAEVNERLPANPVDGVRNDVDLAKDTLANPSGAAEARVDVAVDAKVTGIDPTKK